MGTHKWLLQYSVLIFLSTIWSTSGVLPFLRYLRYNRPSGIEAFDHWALDKLLIWLSSLGQISSASVINNTDFVSVNLTISIVNTGLVTSTRKRFIPGCNRIGLRDVGDCLICENLLLLIDASLSDISACSQDKGLWVEQVFVELVGIQDLFLRHSLFQ